jgi:hypothetical protein
MADDERRVGMAAGSDQLIQIIDVSFHGKGRASAAALERLDEPEVPGEPARNGSGLSRSRGPAVKDIDEWTGFPISANRELIVTDKIPSL